MNRFALSFLVGVVAAGSVFADEAADQKAAREIVERGVKAAKWDKLPTNANMTWKETGVMKVMDMKFEYVADWAFAAPEKLGFSMTATFMGQKIDIKAAVVKDKAWESGMGMVREVTGEKLEYTLNEVYHLYVISLNPLLKDDQFKLKPIADKDVNGNPAAGIEVTRKDKPAIKLYFDKKTGLLSKSEFMAKDEFQNWKLVLNEVYFLDSKDAGDVKVFGKMKMVRDGGKSSIESEFSEQKWPEKLDEKLFEKPSGK